MDLKVGSVVIDVNDLDSMCEFWSAVLGYEPEYDGDDWVKLSPADGSWTNVSLQLVPEPKTEKNRLHLDLYARDRDAEVERLIRLGARKVRDAGRDDDFIVLADPEDNLFCVIDKSDIV